MNLSLMEPTLEVDDKADTALGQVADDETKSVELLKVQLVLNFPVREEVGKNIIERYFYSYVQVSQKSHPSCTVNHKEMLWGQVPFHELQIIN